ncbi:MAG: Ig-like domain-containing protein [Gemmatimonadetes bacterium]|nr:Ig-like domain-containing protein [Gemmatimonadota bacterium]
MTLFPLRAIRRPVPVRRRPVPIGGRLVPILALALAACGGDAAPPVPASLTVFPNALSFASLADTARLSATVRDENGEVMPGATITWLSDDATIARITPPERAPSVLVTSVANGNATITATAGSARGSATVQVEQVATTVEITAPTDSLMVGDSVQMTAHATDAAGSDVADALFSWESSDPGVATVDDNGWVRARAPGSAEITATLGELRASAALTLLPLPERTVLQAIYDAGGGALWKDNTNWLTDAPLAEWFGVHLNDDGQVVHLLLTDNGLIGTIAPEITSLTHLESLHIGLNDLAGPLPPEIAHLKRLKSLELTYNAFDGPIPPEIGGLESLEWLGAFGNAFSGEIPPEIGKLGQLQSLDLCYNRLTGPIPPEIGDLASLKRLALCGIDANPTEGNRLSGEIPSEIGKLTNLSLLSLGANRLTGPIPPEIGNLTELDSLLLYSNELTAIPPEIGNLESLEWLVLYGNRLAGSIPPEIGKLHNLRILHIGWGWASGRNLLTGPIPPEIGNLTGLQHVDLGGNQLSGPIPPEIGNLRSLTNLELGSNMLEGAIPAEIGNLTRLTSFAACPNSLEGRIPPEFGKLQRLTQLFLCTNELSGPMPADLGQLHSLRQLIVAGNRLTSAVPASMVSLSRLREFYWQNNDGLCVPLLTEFDSWLARIPAHRGDRCAPASAQAAESHGSLEGVRMGAQRHVTRERPLSPRPVADLLRRR